jgi:PAS domain S-box-containing protein
MDDQLRIRTAEVEQLQRQNKRVHEEKQRIENIVRNMAEGMVVLDARGRIVLANSAAETLLGITKQDVGRPIRDVVKDEHLLTLTKSIPTGPDEVVEKDIELIGSDESTKRVLRTSSAVVEDPNGNTVGMVTMLNDITRQKEVERLKSEFLAGVFHELRTPLVAVEKSVSLMLDASSGALSSDQQQLLTIAHRNIKRLTLLINDLLDLAKIESHKVELRCSLGAFDTVVRDAVENFAQWAQTKKISIECNVQPGLPEFSFDANRITQVLMNLIGNALKFTPVDGRITVSADMDAERLNVRVIVEDTGPGIDEDDIEKVFEKFYQAKNRPASDINGTGIGLAIVKEVVQMHGGRVWSENAASGGARFIFTLPIDAVQQGGIDGSS